MYLKISLFVKTYFPISDELALDTSCRRLVPNDTWLRLHGYFPDAPEFRADAAVCKQCQVKTEKYGKAGRADESSIIKRFIKYRYKN